MAATKYNSDYSGNGYTGKSAQASGIANINGAFGGDSAAQQQSLAIQQYYAQNPELSPSQVAQTQSPYIQKANAVYNPDSTASKIFGDIALAGSAVGIGLLTGGAIAPALAAAGADAAGSLGVIAGDATAGALGGAATSGLEGQSVGKGALLGGVGGGLGAVASPISSSLSNATGLPSYASTGLVKAGIGGATSAVAGANPLLGAVSSGVGSLAGNAASGLGAGAASGLIGNQVGNMAATSVGSTLGGSNIPASVFSSPVNTSLGAAGQQNAGAVVNPSTDASLASTIGGALPGVIQGAAGVYGAQNAAQAQTTAENSAINTQQSTLGNINGIWSTQQQTGQGANSALQSSLGLGGAPANPSNFLNMPGYQFAVQQGTQAIQRQAAAMGNAYTPNTAEAVGQYVTGTASQDYNTYISQLMGAAGLGTTANQGLQTGQQTTGSNISQLQQNIGQAQASGVQGAANAVGGMFGANGTGTSLIGAAGKYLGGGAGATPSTTGLNIAPGTDPAIFGGVPGGTGYVPNNGNVGDTSGDYGFGVAPTPSYTAPSWTDSNASLSFLGDGS